MVSEQEGSRRETKRSNRSRRRKLILGSIIVFLVLTLGISSGFYIYLDGSLPDTASLQDYQPPVATSIYAADGSLIAELYEERRYVVPFSELPQHLTKAFLAAEDERFYEHPGVDLYGIMRAFFKNLLAWEIVQGGSTITQQVVKSLLLTPERSLSRKAREVVLAYRIDRSLSKDEILHIYLNQIYLGSGAYGVEAAARTYFGKHARDLSLPESALLAGLPKAPSRFSPLHNFEAAKERQRYVLQRMAEVGFISAAEAQNAVNQPLHLSSSGKDMAEGFDHFTEEVRREVESRYGRELLVKGGLSIHTTLEPAAQKIARKAMEQELDEIDGRKKNSRGLYVNIPRESRKRFLDNLAQSNSQLEPGKVVAALVASYDAGAKACKLDLGGAKAVLPSSGWEWADMPPNRISKMFRPGDVIRVRLDGLGDEGTWSVTLEENPPVEGALIAIEPQTGRVLCMIGGRDFDKSQFNRATQAVRQPGSVFKPIIYAAALQKGYTEASILVDAPFVRDDQGPAGPWKPVNHDRQFWGPVTLRKALVHSRNVVAVRLLDSIGVDCAIDFARQLGITSPLTPTLALALGASGVTPMEIATAYTPFANRGDRVAPYLIEKIIDRNGRLLEEHQVQRHNVMPPETAFIMTHLLQGVVEEGTGRKALALGRPAAGKTGTTNDQKDAWFVGYTPSVLAVVWVGYDDHNVSLAKGETGGRAACPIWLSFMQEFLKGQPVQTFPIPPGVIMARMDPDTGTILSDEQPGGTSVAFYGRLPNPHVSIGRSEVPPPVISPKEEPRLDTAVKSVFGKFKKSVISIKDRLFKRD